jgi:hypothetical protein
MISEAPSRNPESAAENILWIVLVRGRAASQKSFN